MDVDEGKDEMYHIYINIPTILVTIVTQLLTIRL